MEADLHGIVRREVQRILRDQLTIEVELEVVVAVYISSDVLGPGLCVKALSTERRGSSRGLVRPPN